MVLSSKASNAIIYVTYAIVLAAGVGLGLRKWKFRDSREFVSANGTKKAFPLALNFIASLIGCGMFTSAPEIANGAGIHGLMIYAISVAIPILLFAYIGPIIRRECPDGFVLTEWCRERFGYIAMLYLSIWNILVMYLFMMAELSALNTAVHTLCGFSATPAVVVGCLFVTAYTLIGGFRVSFATGSLQVLFVALFLILALSGYPIYVHVSPILKHATYHELTGANKSGWMMLYVLPVAMVGKAAFMTNLWVRTFAAETDKDLFLATSIASVFTPIVCILAGLPGIYAVWSGYLPVASAGSYRSFFVLCSQMQNWVTGVVLILVLLLSACTFCSLLSATTASVSNDFFRNKIDVTWTRVIVLVAMVPSLAVAVKAPVNTLQVYLVAGLLSSTIVPLMLLGLWHNLSFLRGLDIVVGSLGAILIIYIFGNAHFGSSQGAGKLLIVGYRLHSNADWSVFGAFVISLFGGIAVGLVCAALRIRLLKWNSHRRDKAGVVSAADFATNTDTKKSTTWKEYLEELII